MSPNVKITLSGLLHLVLKFKMFITENQTEEFGQKTDVNVSNIGKELSSWFYVKILFISEKYRQFCTFLRDNKLSTNSEPNMSDFIFDARFIIAIDPWGA